MGKAPRSWWKILLLVVLGLILIPVIYRLPPVYSRLSWRINDLRTRIIYAINPPDEAVFQPEEQAQIAAMVQGTFEALTPTVTATPEATTSPDPAQSSAPRATATITSTPLPESIYLDGVVYVDQHYRWNYCGPANLTMALKFWGWEGDRDDVARVVKPGVEDPSLDFIQRGFPDKNVMPYELANFVTDHTEFNIVVRYGGEMDLIKQFLARGIPVLIEKGYYERDYTGKIAWLGHYLFITGYDETTGTFNVQDAYLEPGQDLSVPYQEFQDGWRGFNYLFMVVYPLEREAEVFDLLGPWADDAWANRHALDIANEEINTQEGIDEFFAWFNKGTSHVQLFEYGDAAFAYDYAFLLYSGIGEEEEETQRPYRIMWYQTGPYWAYYYTSRYQDVINLAETTLYETVSEPTLEESIYWRGMAYLALGQTQNAVDDFLETVRLNVNFAPGWEMLNQLGVSP